LWAAGSDLEAPRAVGETDLGSVLADREATSATAREEERGLLEVVPDDDHRSSLEDTAPPELPEDDRITWAEALHRSDDIRP
jgi:hypothetical protein